MVCVQKVLFDDFDRRLPASVLRLEQHDGPHVLWLVRGLGLQVAAAQQRVAHGILPDGFVLGQHDGQLDHVLSLQLAG